MTGFGELSPEEQARQLRDPHGAAGVATADTLADVNRDGNAFLIASLGLERGDVVLEVGCGLGAMAAVVTGSAQEIEYVGLDRSQTMIDAARERHRALTDTGRACFLVASTEQIPFPDSRFSKVFSAGVIHFWADPAQSLAELKRVMRTDGAMSMGCLAPGSALPFAQPEYGFHLRTPDEWTRIAQEAGFEQVEASLIGPSGGPQMIHLRARAGR